MNNNNNNQMPLQQQQQQQQPTPPQLPSGSGGVLGANQFNYPNVGNQYDYQNGGNQFNYRNGGNQFYYRNGGNQNNYRNRGNQYFYPNRNRNYYNGPPPPRRPYYGRRNNFYYQQPPNFNNNGYDNGGYGIVTRPPPRFNGMNQNRPRSRSNDRGGGRSQSGRRSPRPLRLNDFMPPQLRDTSPNAPNLPQDFNLVTTTNTIPANVLPQRQHFATTAATTTNTTQPFIVNNQDGSNQQQQQPYNGRYQQTTTAAYRRRQRRNRQQQYRQNLNTNRFTALTAEEGNDQMDIESNVADEPEPLLNNNIKKKNKIKTRLYLQPNRILKWFEDTSKSSISGRGNQAYVLASTSIYDQWIRNNYELQVWQAYLKMGTENKHWAKEVVQRTKRRDDIINRRFIQKKINCLASDITQANTTITDLQIQLGTYWTQTLAQSNAQTNAQTTAELTSRLILETMGQTSTQTIDPTTAPTTNTTTATNRDRVEKAILKYIQHCTQHVKKMCELRMQLAKIQMEEFKALEDFEQIATPTQWNIHLMLKPKMKTLSIKNKNNLLATKRVEYDLPPKFIGNTELSFKIDESIINQEEVQALYNQMRQITKDYRNEAMTLYVQACAREQELLSNEIKTIIEGIPKENDDEAGYAAFKQYHDLREKRFKLEAEQSVYFLVEQRVEGESNNNQEQEEIIAPALIRTLSEDFLLQQL
jgi:hypothetical protein